MHTENTWGTAGFTGITGEGSLVDLIHMECSIMATRAVRIERDEMSGRIYFLRGQVVHAETGSLSGEAALFEMLGWNHGHVIVVDGVRAQAQTIARHWQSLLMEADSALIRRA